MKDPRKKESRRRGTKIKRRVDDIRAGKVKMIPGERELR